MQQYVNDDNTPTPKTMKPKNSKWALVLAAVSVAFIVLGLALVTLTFIAVWVSQTVRYHNLLAGSFVLGLFFIFLGLTVYLLLNKSGMSTPKKLLVGATALFAELVFSGMLLLWIVIGAPYGFIHYKYNDDWIVGRNITEVEERYGQARKFNDNSYGYVLYKENFGLDPRSIDIYYGMFTDDNGVVTQVDYSFEGFGG
ncbi:MAG: hypothetical protein IKS49_07535 [Actinomycetaceae bacterium]|nr:hypothetical protein [Actinomycetaceae bacterium]